MQRLNHRVPAPCSAARSISLRHRIAFRALGEGPPAARRAAHGNIGVAHVFRRAQVAHAGSARTTSAEDARRALRRRRPARRFARAVAHSGLELSPATIRNVMADLEEMGLIASPHTSAGPRAHAARLPLLRRQPDGREAARGRRDPSARRRAQPSTGRSSSSTRPRQLLSQLTQFAGVVATPKRREAVVPPPRVPAPVRPARAADHRDARRRRAEPHPAHRPRRTRRRS